MLLKEPLGFASGGDFSSGGGVAEGDAVLGFELMQVLGGAVVVAFHVADGHLQDFALGEAAGERAVGGFQCGDGPACRCI